jgi:hypothetical protein
LAGPRFLGRLVLHQFDSPEVAGSADVADDRDIFQGVQAVAEVVLIGQDVFEYVLILDDLDALKGNGARDGVTGPGETVNEGGVVVLEGLGDAVRDDHGTDGVRSPN